MLRRLPAGSSPVISSAMRLADSMTVLMTTSRYASLIDALTLPAAVSVIFVATAFFFAFS